MGEFPRSSLRRLWCAECAVESIHGRHGCIHHPMTTPVAKPDGDTALLLRLKRLTGPLTEVQIVNFLDTPPRTLRNAMQRDQRIRLEVMRLVLPAK
jgi:hypothetical protein